MQIIWNVGVLHCSIVCACACSIVSVHVYLFLKHNAVRQVPSMNKASSRGLEGRPGGKACCDSLFSCELIRVRDYLIIKDNPAWIASYIGLINTTQLLHSSYANQEPILCVHSPPGTGADPILIRTWRGHVLVAVLLQVAVHFCDCSHNYFDTVVNHTKESFH